MGRKTLRSRCQRCSGKGWVWTQKMGVHSSDPKRAETVRVKDPCTECDGRGFHVTIVGQ